MRHVRTLGMCVVAAAVLSAIVATSASALPEFGKCEVSPTHEGKYTDSNCVKKAKLVGGKGTGEFEWHISTTFKGNVKEFSNGTGETVPAVLTTQLHECEPSFEKLAKCREGEKESSETQKVECTAIFDRGEFSSKSDKEVRNVHVSFTGCKALGFPCSNTSTVGEIETNLLTGTLGYIKKAAPKEVGIVVKPQTGKTFAIFNCAGQITFTVGEGTLTEGPFYLPKGGGDAVIGVIDPINEMTSSFTQTFTANEETAENIPSKFEGKPLQVLEDFFTHSKWSPAGQTVTVKNSCKACSGSEGVGEVKA